MREILFRGKDVDNGAWHEGQYIHLHKTTYCFAGSAKRDAENEIHQIVFEVMTDWNLPNRHLRADVIPETVGQYTGLTDKNGKKIFEGDIVKNEFEKGHYQYFKIFYCDRTHMWQGENKYGMLSKVYQMLGTLEVIGNIHDNPELLNLV